MSKMTKNIFSKNAAEYGLYFISTFSHYIITFCHYFQIKAVTFEPVVDELNRNIIYFIDF